FGISDLSNTVVHFGSAIAVMGMYDAMYRMFFDNDDESFKKDVCSTALVFTCFTSLIVFIVMVLCKNIIAYYFFSDSKYAYVVYLSAMATLVGATNSIISAPTRMQNKRKVFLVTNTISPLISYAVAIPVLMAGYYTVALPLAAVVSGVTMEVIFGILNFRWFNPKRFNFRLLRQLLIIAIPLLPNFLIYWVFNSCDKVMITNLMGVGAAGIYAVGSKLGHCSQLIYTAFAGGWQFFAFSTMKEKNQVKSNSMVFEYLGIIAFATTAFVCAWSFGIFKILFTDQYLEGYIVAPYLFLAPLLQMLFQVAANQFLVIKKTWPNMLILSVGAVINIAFNSVFIPVLGIEGASIATLLGYAVSVVVCVLVLCRMNLMEVNSRFIVSVCLMVGFFILWRLLFNNNIVVSTLLAVLLSASFVFLYKSDIVKLLHTIKENKS
ncbi:MAG: polysaccharide biosynthesis protein, partial [Clostridiaceae bacterium]|nr:polysaccharide biosynthesis protein [Clostridiaceae bacterium]